MLQIREYWAVVAKRWWILLLMVAITSTVAYGYSKSQRPIFRSSVSLLVEPARYDYGLTLVVQQILRQYSRMMQTTELAKLIDQQLHLDLTPDQLRAQLKISAVVEDSVLQIDVENPDPGLAQRIAGALATSFVDERSQAMSTRNPSDRIDVSMLDEPSPAVLSRPRTSTNVVAGAFLGLLLGLVIAFFLEFLDDTIKTSDDVDKFVASPVIGTIPTISSVETRRQS